MTIVESIIDTTTAVAETMRRLVTGNREQDIAALREVLAAPPIPPTLREIREAAELRDEERARDERQARDSLKYRLEKKILAVEPASLRAFRSWLDRETRTHLYVVNDRGSLERRAPITRATERSGAWSARPVKAETNAGYLARLAEVFGAARRALEANADLGGMRFLQLDELETAIAHHRASIEAAIASEEFQDFPPEHLWMFRDSPGSSWWDLPHSW